MEDSSAAFLPSSSFTVSSPRRALSLLKRGRRVGAAAAAPSSSYQEEDRGTRGDAGRFAGEHGPKPSEVYGFVGSISTVIATGTGYWQFQLMQWSQYVWPWDFTWD